ncbi:pilus assembly protein CpaC [Desulfonatronum thiosulfatophilum]|uniref:Pilus assembly protein CpaC n=1 Tax=Desulfonatronum thiosulfatophilum TaxID=617002 RepID=A0A1G6C871_9BACT|nr:type II and III secretion system protein family protein [Desulfonatronum thiosulfatophilum]SDB29085.1 pilus assembly protein CpaC [Desulfonatronum thiosulfatophilum]
MPAPIRSWKTATVLLLLASLAWLLPLESQAQNFQVAPDEVIVDMDHPRRLQLEYGRAVILRAPREVDRALVADPDVVSVRAISAREIYLRPTSAGTTNLMLWQGNEISAIYELEVRYEIARMKQRINEVFPRETDLRILSTNNSITLSGRVSNTSTLDQILAMAEAYAPQDRIRNLVQVGGVHQVMLEVKVADVSRNSMKQLGVNFNLVNESGRFALGFLGGLPPQTMRGTFTFSSAPGDSIQWQGIFDILKESGLAKILAEPSLIALSGQTASFLAGGQIPLPTLDSRGEIGGVEFKDYGIQLSFTPTVLSEDRIAIEVVPVVSELDPTREYNILGTPVPGIIIRQASTTVELGDGQSFAIAGLLSETSREVAIKFPGLGDLPILGALFSNKRYQSNETELVILITPRLVKPIVAAEQTLPTDFYIPPDDAEFYLWEIFGQSHTHNLPHRTAVFDGQFGHVIVR